jgi:hypothetical protein
MGAKKLAQDSKAIQPADHQAGITRQRMPRAVGGSFA